MQLPLSHGQGDFYKILKLLPGLLFPDFVVK